MVSVLFAQHTISNSKTITRKVFQGSLLGPLVFLIYDNDIFLAASKVSFHLFADDTSYYTQTRNTKQLENEINSSLDSVTNWLKENK